MPHLSELHGAATHLAVVTIPLYLIVLLVRRSGRGERVLEPVEPWVVAGAVVGVVLAGVTGLLVRGEAQTELRGSAGNVGTVHFWLGIATFLIVFSVAGWRWRHARAERHTHRLELVAGGVVAVIAVLVQGYLGGRMTYHQGVGVWDGGQWATTAAGVAQLDVALATGSSEVAAGRQAFSPRGLGCALCHGDRAQGLRGPRLAGGVDLSDFRHVHAHGLFPASVVTDRDFHAVDAYLETLGNPRKD